MRNKITVSIIRIYFPFFILLFLIPVCSKQIIKDEPEAKTLNQEETSRLIKIITDINNNAPDSFSLKINIDGIINNKILKSSGEAVYNDTPRLMKINFVDNLFGSTLATIIQHGETVKLYFPVEKTLYMDNINTINLRNYADINIDYYIIAGLASGRIPLLKDYHIKNAFEKDENGRLNENDIYIILENNLYYETIAFKGDIPDKILIINKNTKEKTEIYLKNPFKDRDITFFNTIQFISTVPDYKITVEFSGIKINKDIDLKKISKIDLPKGCKVIYTDR